jgi:hypothetical protein
MSTRSQFRQIQGPVSHSCPNEYQRLSDLILAEHPELKGKFTIMVFDNFVSIKADNYATFVLAKSAIKSYTTLEIRSA